MLVSEHTLLPNNLAVITQRFPFILSMQSEDKAQDRLTLDTQQRTAWFSNTPQLRNGAWVTCGWGEHIREALKRLPQGVHLAVYEASLAHLLDSLSTQDYSDVLSDSRLLLFAGDPEKQDFFILNQWHLVLMDGLEPWLISDLYESSQGANDLFLKTLATSWAQMVRYSGTLIDDSPKWQAMTLKNWKHIALAPDVGGLHNQFEGVPTVLISAGPSLDLSFDFLRKIQDRALLVCVNSAYSAVREEGIVPHITIAADFRDSTYLGYGEGPKDKSYLMCTSFAQHEIVEAFAGRVFTWSSKNALYSWMRNQIGMGDGTLIHEMGTVASCAIPLAHLWGSDELYLVGQDFAFAADGKTHAGSSFYKDDKYQEKDIVRWVEANNNTQVAQDGKLSTYADSFEVMIRRYPKVECVNLSPLGSVLKGAPFADFEFAEEQIMSHSVSYDCWETLDSLNHVSKAIDVSQPRELLVKYVRGIQKKAAVAAVYTQEKLKEGNVSEAGMKHAYKLADEVNRSIDQYPEQYEVLMQGSLRQHLYRYFAWQRKQEPTGDKARDTLMQNERYFWALVDGTQELLKELMEESS